MAAVDDEGLCLISLCAADGVGPSTIVSLQRAARARGVSLREVMALPMPELEADLDLTPVAARAVSEISAPMTAGRAVLDALDRIGARAVIAGDADYPDRLTERLGNQAPPVLFLAGDAALLQRPSRAVVGSRAPSRRAVQAARLLSAQQAGAGFAVVSGGAHGIDTAAHLAAAVAGGTVVVPALGIARYRPLDAGAGRAVHGRWCVVGQFPPHAAWRGAQALVRNRTIVALSDAVVAFEPRDCGGTYHTSLTAFRMRKPLFVVTASADGAKDRGLKRLVRLGAVALDPSCMPDADALARLIAEYRPPPGADQLPLFEGPQLA
jgi:predicted Rossmann fold nucleotide-binding protein DprA/Smf involved in DNA uptake